MCKICKGKDLKCNCRSKFSGFRKGQSVKKSKKNKIINQKGAFGKNIEK